MEEQLELADVVATILGFHIRELPQTVIPAKTTAQLNPDIRSAYLIRQQLEPYLERDGRLQERLQALAAEPGESTRQMMADELRPLFENNLELRAEIEEIARRSPYAVMFGLEHAIGPDHYVINRARQKGHMAHLVLWLFVQFAVSVFLIQSDISRLATLILSLGVPGVLVGYYANKMEIKRPFWLGVGAAFPANIIFILLAMGAYRRQVDEIGGERIYYLSSLKAFTATIVGLLVLQPIVLFVINPDYMKLFFASELGLVLFAIAILSYGLLLASFGIGFWLDRAKTGIGMAMTCTIGSWSIFVSWWITFLGPSLIMLAD